MKLRRLAMISVACALVALTLRSQLKVAESPRSGPKAEPPLTPQADRRGPEFTFLTFPEWYLVYSPDEYADFIKNTPPSEFPFLGHLQQFWRGYGVMADAIKDDYPFNLDYHLMIWIIGTSTTIEYGLKWAYETIVGRVTEATRFGAPTAEDRLAAQVAREYVNFLDVEPWYKFDFATPLKRTWTETGWWGPDPIRKWERKYYLTSEFAVKAVYGWLMKKASESAYEEEKPVTAAVLDRVPMDPMRLPDMKELKDLPDGGVLVHVPRYQAFTKHAQALAKAGISFREIAGNRGDILVSAVAPVDYDAAGLKLLMKQPIMTRPGMQRLVFTVAVPDLAAMIRERDRPPFRLEHVYDY